MSEKVTLVWFPAKISAVFCKLFPIDALIFRFLIKHLHISYKFSYTISDQEICLAMLYKLCKFPPIFFFIVLRWFGHSKKNLMLGYICKVVSSGYNNYVICIS